MLVVLFGLAGSGKTYVGKLLSVKSDFYFWDADEALTDEMKEYIRDKRSFTQAMRDRYFSIVIERMKILCTEHEHVVVSQAFYKNKNREQVLSEFPDSLFIQVSVEFKALLKRLRERNNSVDEDYATQISVNFEAPTHQYYLINNNLENDEESLVRQFILIPRLASVLARDINKTQYIDNSERAIGRGTRLHRLFPIVSDVDLRVGLHSTPMAEHNNNSGLKNPSGAFRFFSAERSYQTGTALENVELHYLGNTG